MTKKRFKWDFWKIVALIITLLFILFLVYPLINLFVSGFQTTVKVDGVKEVTWSFANFIKFFSKKYYVDTLLNTIKLTVCVTAITVLVGVPLAYFMAFYVIRGRRLLEILFIISMMSPNFIGAYSWILLLGRSGTITKFFASLGITTPSIYGFGGMVLVFSLKLYPFIYMYVSGALKKIDVSLSEAAEGLGCGNFRKIFTVIMPLVKPTVVAAALLVFMNCMADFGTPALIGEGYRVMPTLIYSEFLGETGGNANFAACLSTMMVIVTAIIFLIQKWYINRKSYEMNALKPIQPKKKKGAGIVFVHIFIYLLAALSIIPQCMVIYTSFRKTNMQIFVEGYSLENYRKVLDTALSSIKNTYLLCIIAILIIVALGMLIAYLAVRRKSIFTNIIDSVAMFPYIIPGSVLGITILIAFNKKPLMLMGTPTIMIISLVIRRMAYTLRSSNAILYQISPSVEEAAISLGDSQGKAFLKVTGRMMIPGVISGAILSWITLINELSSSVMLYTASTRTMSVAIYNEVVRANYGTAAALASILTASTVISLLIFFKVTDSRDVSV